MKHFLKIPLYFSSKIAFLLSKINAHYLLSGSSSINAFFTCFTHDWQNKSNKTKIYLLSNLTIQLHFFYKLCLFSYYTGCDEGKKTPPLVNPKSLLPNQGPHFYNNLLLCIINFPFYIPYIGNIPKCICISTWTCICSNFFSAPVPFLSYAVQKSSSKQLCAPSPILLFPNSILLPPQLAFCL